MAAAAAASSAPPANLMIPPPVSSTSIDNNSQIAVVQAAINNYREQVQQSETNLMAQVNVFQIKKKVSSYHDCLHALLA